MGVLDRVLCLCPSQTASYKNVWAIARNHDLIKIFRITQSLVGRLKIEEILNIFLPTSVGCTVNRQQTRMQDRDGGLARDVPP